MGRNSPTLSAVVHAVKNSSELKQFSDEQPATVKWSCISRGTVTHYKDYGILVKTEGPWSIRQRRQVWELSDWVEKLLRNDYPTLSDEQADLLYRYGDELLELEDEFEAGETSFAGRTMGAMREHGLVEIVEDNRGWPDPTVWKTNGTIEKVRELYDELDG